MCPWVLAVAKHYIALHGARQSVVLNTRHAEGGATAALYRCDTGLQQLLPQNRRVLLLPLPSPGNCHTHTSIPHLLSSQRLLVEPS